MSEPVTIERFAYYAITWEGARLVMASPWADCRLPDLIGRELIVQGQRYRIKKVVHPMVSPIAQGQRVELRLEFARSLPSAYEQH